MFCSFSDTSFPMQESSFPPWSYSLNIFFFCNLFLYFLNYRFSQLLLFCIFFFFPTLNINYLQCSIFLTLFLCFSLVLRSVTLLSLLFSLFKYFSSHPTPCSVISTYLTFNCPLFSVLKCYSLLLPFVLII